MNDLLANTNDGVALAVVIALAGGVTAIVLWIGSVLYAGMRYRTIEALDPRHRVTTARRQLLLSIGLLAVGALVCASVVFSGMGKTLVANGALWLGFVCLIGGVLALSRASFGLEECLTSSRCVDGGSADAGVITRRAA